MGIFILPSLFFYHLLFPIPSILFYLFLPSRDPVALNIGRHLYSDPGSIVKVFQHMMALWLLESPPGTLLQGPRVGPAVRVKKSRTFSQPCDRKCKLYHENLLSRASMWQRILWPSCVEWRLFIPLCVLEYTVYIYFLIWKKNYWKLFLSVTPLLIHDINLWNKLGKRDRTEVLCFHTQEMWLWNWTL